MLSSLSEKKIRISWDNLFVFFLFLLMPYLFFAIGINFFEVALAPGDGIMHGVPTKIFTSEIQLWNPYIQTGSFPLKDIGWQVLYLPGIIVMHIFPNVFGYNLLLLSHYSLAGFFTFLFLDRLRLKRTAAFIGGITFMFCGFLTAHKGHHTMMMAASYLPAVFYFFECYATTKKTRYLMIAGITFGMSILADYIAVPMYIGMMLFPYMVCTFLLDRTVNVGPGNDFQAFAQKMIARSFQIMKSSFIIFGIGLFLAAIQLVPIIESLNYVTRQSITYDFFSSYAFNIRLAPLLIFPFFYGPSSAFLNTKLTYFGPWNLTELTGYIGILPIFFSLMAVTLFWKKNWRIGYMGSFVIFAGILVIGDATPLYKFMYHLPIYNMFRVPARNWLEFNFAIAVLGGIFVHYAVEASHIEIKRYKRIILLSLVIIWVIVILIATYGYKLGVTQATDRLLYENSRLSSPTMYIPMVIIFISTIFLLLLPFLKQKKIFWLFVSILIFLDLFSFGHFHDTDYVEFDIFNSKTNDVVSFLNNDKTDKDLYRIYPLWPYQVTLDKQIYPSINMLFDFNVINAYGAIWLKDYEKLTSFASNGIAGSKESLLQNSRILSLLSTKYLLVSNPQEKKYIETLFIDNIEKEDNELIYEDRSEDRIVSFAEIKEDSIVLKSLAPGGVSLYQVPLKLELNTNYKISFKARTPVDRSVNNHLIVDFFGKDYDTESQESYFSPPEVSPEFRDFNTIFNSGINAPQSAFLRIYTFSNIPYEIKDIRIYKVSNYQKFWGVKKISLPSPLYMLRHESPEGVAVYENMNFLPRARFVNDILRVENSTIANYKLWNDQDLDPSLTALVEGYSGNTSFESGEVIDGDYSKNDVVNLTVKTGDQGFLVLSDTFYVGWKAFVDGKETPIYKANATSRGIIINGPGIHAVTFQFVPISFYIGLALSILTLSIVVIFMIKLRK